MLVVETVEKLRRCTNPTVSRSGRFAVSIGCRGVECARSSAYGTQYETSCQIIGEVLLNVPVKAEEFLPANSTSGLERACNT